MHIILLLLTEIASVTVAGFGAPLSVSVWVGNMGAAQSAPWEV